MCLLYNFGLSEMIKESFVREFGDFNLIYVEMFLLIVFFDFYWRVCLEVFFKKDICILKYFF